MSALFSVDVLKKAPEQHCVQILLLPSLRQCELKVYPVYITFFQNKVTETVLHNLIAIYEIQKNTKKTLVVKMRGGQRAW